MLKPISYSVGTQALTSAGNFLISILIVRLASLEAFGQYVYIFAISGVASSITNTLTGGVYPFLRPRYAKFAKIYQKNYNGLNVIIIAVATLIASLIITFLAPREEPLAPYVVPLFVLSFISLDNFRLQASANGLHSLMFYIELSRLTVFGAVLVVLTLYPPVTLNAIMTVQVATGLAACAILIGQSGIRVSFRRLKWVSRRHMSYGRYLLPAGMIGFFHSAGLQLLAGHHFGPQATGLLRLAELPFSALNPAKQSLIYFLPRVLYDFDQRPVAERELLLVKLAVGCVVGSTMIMAGAWAAASVVMPLLTGKDYPVGLGLIFCLAYIFAFLMTPISMYLNTVNKARKILEQTTLGSVVALAVYFGTYQTIGYAASAIGSCACFAAIVLAGACSVWKHNAETAVGAVDVGHAGGIEVAPESNTSGAKPRFPRLARLLPLPAAPGRGT